MPPKLPRQTIAFAGRYQEAEREVMEDWLNQMVAGYQVSHPGSSFNAQLDTYRSKICHAETNLAQMVYHGKASPV